MRSYGSFAARLAGIKNVGVSITGHWLGVFIRNLAFLVKVMYKSAVQGVSQVIFSKIRMIKECFMRYKLFLGKSIFGQGVLV
jgi:hypothetical protein